MNSAKLKPHIFRTLLFFHFLGLAATLGTRLAPGVIDAQTRTAQLPVLLLGRHLIDVSQRLVILPGFLAVLATGVALTLIRYGLRPPLWVWIKVGLVLAMTGIGVFGVGPAAAAAQEWARWSANHSQLAPQLIENVAKSSSYGSVVRVLFLITIAVAIWKPFASIGGRKPKPKRAEVSPAIYSEAQQSGSLV